MKGDRCVDVIYLEVRLLVDSDIVLSTRYGKVRVFINKTLSTETAYQQGLINRNQGLIVSRYEVFQDCCF